MTTQQALRQRKTRVRTTGALVATVSALWLFGGGNSPEKEPQPVPTDAGFQVTLEDDTTCTLDIGHATIGSLVVGALGSPDDTDCRVGDRLRPGELSKQEAEALAQKRIAWLQLLEDTREVIGRTDAELVRLIRTDEVTSVGYTDEAGRIVLFDGQPRPDPNHSGAFGPDACLDGPVPPDTVPDISIWALGDVTYEESRYVLAQTIGGGATDDLCWHGDLVLVRPGDIAYPEPAYSES